VVNITLQLNLAREETLLSIEWAARWAQDPFWTIWRSEQSLSPTEILTLDLLTHSLLTTQIMPCPL